MTTYNNGKTLEVALREAYKELYDVDKVWIWNEYCEQNNLWDDQIFELCDDKYQLSKYHSKHQKIASDEERLDELVPHLISDFKLAIVDEELRQILLKLRQPGILTRKEEYTAIMRHYKEMKDIERTLAKERGDRVIT